MRFRCIWFKTMPVGVFSAFCDESYKLWVSFKIIVCSFLLTLITLKITVFVLLHDIFVPLSSLAAFTFFLFLQRRCIIQRNIIVSFILLIIHVIFEQLTLDNLIDYVIEGFFDIFICLWRGFEKFNIFIFHEGINLRLSH